MACETKEKIEALEKKVTKLEEDKAQLIWALEELFGILSNIKELEEGVETLGYSLELMKD